MFYNSEKNIVNISNSILKHYGVDTFHPSLKELDEKLSSSSKKICVLLFDGLGKHILKRYASSCPFLLEHVFLDLTSVFPPTTVAATTALLSGRYPKETNWLGWTEQFEEFDSSITMFLSRFTKDESLTPISTYELCPYENIISMISKKGYKANSIHSFMLEDSSVDGFFNKTEEEVKNNDFTYAYLTEPDSSMHKYGVFNEEVKKLIENIDARLKDLVNNNKDVSFIFLADHGHQDAKYFHIEEHQDFYNTLRIDHFSIEPRACAFFVKEGLEERFKELATKYYGEHFYILSKEEVIKNNVFGLGKENERFRYCIGDFLLVSKDEWAFNQGEEEGLKSHHAGSSKEEIEISLAWFN